MLYCCRVPRACKKSSERSPSVAVHEEEGVGAAEEAEEEEEEEEEEEVFSASTFSAAAATPTLLLRSVRVLARAALGLRGPIEPDERLEHGLEVLGAQKARMTAPPLAERGSGEAIGERFFSIWKKIKDEKMQVGGSRSSFFLSPHPLFPYLLRLSRCPPFRSTPA